MINLDRFFTQSQIAFALLVIAAALAYLAFGKKMPKKKQKRGNILIILLITTVAILSLGATGYLFVQNKQLQNQIIKPIPPVQNSAPTNNFPTPAPTIDPTANWKTYVNEKYKFSLKYLRGLSVKENQITGDGGLEINFEPTSTVFEDQVTKNIYISVSKTNGNLKTIVENEKAKIVGHVVSKINNESGISVSGTQGIKITFDLINNLERANVFVIKNESLYVISAESKLMDQILSTFKFL